MRPAAALEHRPFEELSPRFRTKENHFVSKSAGEIRSSRQKTASHLISLPRAMVQFTSVLSNHRSPQIFSIDIVSFPIQPAYVRVRPYFRINRHLDAGIARFVAIRCQWVGAVEVICNREGSWSLRHSENAVGGFRLLRSADGDPAGGERSETSRLAPSRTFTMSRRPAGVPIANHWNVTRPLTPDGGHETLTMPRQRWDFKSRI